jgi:peroxiredoxin family protein
MAKEIPENKLSIIMLSGDMDKALVSLVISTGAVAMGMDVVMCFTFWGTPILRGKKRRLAARISWGSRERK